MNISHLNAHHYISSYISIELKQSRKSKQIIAFFIIVITLLLISSNFIGTQYSLHSTRIIEMSNDLAIKMQLMHYIIRIIRPISYVMHYRVVPCRAVTCLALPYRNVLYRIV